MIAPETPAQHVLESYLKDCLRNPSTHRDDHELQLDILYLLTDKVAHRRALAEESILRELAQVRPSDLHLSLADKERVQQVLRPLIQQRLVRQYESVHGESQYELAHDFLVRSVLKAWRKLDRERTEQLAILRQQREKVEEKLTRLDRLEDVANWALRILPLVVLGVVIWFAYMGFAEEMPEWLGISVLWLVVCPSAVIIFMGVARKAPAGVAFGLLAIAACAGIRWYEQTLPLVSVPVYFRRMPPGAADCREFTDSTYRLLRMSPSASYVSEVRLYSECNSISSFLETNPGYAAASYASEKLCQEMADDADYRGPSDSFSHQFVLLRCQDLVIGVGASPLYSRPTARSFQRGILPREVGESALLLLVVLLLIYPKILLDAASGSTGSEIFRWVVRLHWSELVDIVATLSLFVSAVAIANLIADYPLINLAISPSAVYEHVQFRYRLYLLTWFAISLLFSVPVFISRRTLGGFVAKVSLDSQSKGAGLFLRVLIRELAFVAWSLLNIPAFFIPALILTPAIVRLRKSHQTIYDSLLGFTAIHGPHRESAKEDPQTISGDADRRPMPREQQTQAS
jgi:hypothetical protein